MLAEDRLQPQRFELKYFITEKTAVALRDLVRAYLVLDEYGMGQEDYSYPIHSVYLDSEALELYWQTVSGLKNRFKLRLRYYDAGEQSPVFLEIKRRVDAAILKQRAAIRRGALPGVMGGDLPGAADILSPEPAAMASIHRFMELMFYTRATPRAHLSYRREAWVSAADNSIRVTMDRHIRCSPMRVLELDTSEEHGAHLFPDFVVLEIKFTGRFPNWFADMAQCFELTRTSTAKYVNGVTVLGEDKFRGRHTAQMAGARMGGA